VRGMYVLLAQHRYQPKDIPSYHADLMIPNFTFPCEMKRKSRNFDNV
jgi:hypothetical protein